MEYPDGILHEDVLIAEHPSFHPAAVCAVTDCTDITGIALVAVYLDLCTLAAGLHSIAVCREYETGCHEALELLLSAHNILRAAPLLWMGEPVRPCVPNEN